MGGEKEGGKGLARPSRLKGMLCLTNLRPTLECPLTGVDGQTIQALVRAGKYEFSKHAEREREAGQISVEELEEAPIRCETIEEYPDDLRGPSCLVLGLSGERPLHAVSLS